MHSYEWRCGACASIFRVESACSHTDSTRKMLMAGVTRCSADGDCAGLAQLVTEVRRTWPDSPDVQDIFPPRPLGER